MSTSVTFDSNVEETSANSNLSKLRAIERFMSSGQELDFFGVAVERCSIVQQMGI